ncbi:MAG: glutathione S-transferase C-terminal domain-containing protein [Gammaproteobacteria bacterium]|nr:glutathione S-transferase C-terminal domain-containing protein [Gammaproteobacteria bacterium]MBT8443930.1 glutathione S-transferase C-terminal domain-containing protein [Gammaproteobacteria bacterium]
MPDLKLTVLSLRYSSWSMRPWLALTHAGATFATETVELAHMQQQADFSAGTIDLTDVEPTPLADRRALGSVHGLFPVLRVDEVPIHESLAICEYTAEAFPAAGLWPDDPLDRAQARAISCEMVGGFSSMRNQLACHLFGRVPGFVPSAETQADIDRVIELWSACLERSGGPFLFGRFTIADAMYFPVLTRLRTYDIPLAATVADYARALNNLPAVQKLLDVAQYEPRTKIYDDYLRALGGDPDAALPG